MKTGYLILIAFLGFIVYKKNSIMKIWEDKWTELRIEKLHPSIKDKVKAFIQDAANKGIFLRVTDGMRTFDEQNVLYNQGRNGNTKPVVTNAKAGQSFHNYGLAFDVVPMVDGVNPVWNDQTLWAQIGTLGKKHGFTWGGNFNSITDFPHFEMTFGLSHNQLLQRWNDGNIDNGYVNLDSYA